MKHIAILNPKGGCGKTTIATHLAVYASTLGVDVALADHDAQHSSHDWMKSRPSRCADIDLIAAYRGDALGRNYDVVIHDLPAGDFSTSHLPLDVCSKIVIPLMPSPIDLKAALQLWVSLSEQGWLDNPDLEFAIVANRVKPNTKFLSTFNEFVEKLGITRVATLRDTQNYIRSMDNGLTLFDLPPGQVAKDLVQWEPLMEWSGFLDFDDEDIQALLQGIMDGSDSDVDAMDSDFAFASDFPPQAPPSADSLTLSDSQLDQKLVDALARLSEEDASQAPTESARTTFLKAHTALDSNKPLAAQGSEDTQQKLTAEAWLGDEFSEDREFISLDDYHAEQLQDEVDYGEVSDLD